MKEAILILLLAFVLGACHRTPTNDHGASARIEEAKKLVRERSVFPDTVSFQRVKEFKIGAGYALRLDFQWTNAEGERERMIGMVSFTEETLNAFNVSIYPPGS